MHLNRHTAANAFWALVRLVQATFSRQPVIARSAVQEIRMVRCLQCPLYDVGSEQCIRCTCFVAVKTMLATESCPIGKWGKVTRFSSGLVDNSVTLPR